MNCWIGSETSPDRLLWFDDPNKRKLVVGVLASLLEFVPHHLLVFPNIIFVSLGSALAWLGTESVLYVVSWIL